VPPIEIGALAGMSDPYPRNLSSRLAPVAGVEVVTNTFEGYVTNGIILRIIFAACWPSLFGQQAW
jgi:hypothetical protein